MGTFPEVFLSACVSEGDEAEFGNVRFFPYLCLAPLPWEYGVCITQNKILMNKIYSDQIEKARLLIDGVNKNRDYLASKGYDLSIIGTLERDIEEMQREGEAVAREELALSEHRSRCHAILDRFKDDLLAGKAGIKNRFDQEQWSRYGVPDKR